MADKTAIFESTQALFCALADYVGKGNIDKVFDLKKFAPPIENLRIRIN